MKIKEILSLLFLSSLSCFSMENQDDLELNPLPQELPALTILIDVQTGLFDEDKLKYQDITNLLARLDRGEEILHEEFSQTICHSIKQAISLQDLDVQAKNFANLYCKIMGKDTDIPRFTDITTPYFLTLVDIMSSFAENNTINPLIRSRIAFAISCAYSSILPRSGLPIDDPYIQGNLKWLNYIIDRYEELGMHDPAFYAERCLYVSGIYERRAEKAFPDIPLDAHNPYLEIAKAYLQKGATALRNVKFLSYFDVISYLKQDALMQEKYLPKGATLQDKCVKDTIQAFEQWAEFSSNPPHKRMSLYINPGTALKKLEMIRAIETSDLKKAEELSNEYEQDVARNGYEMWDFSERWACERDSDSAKAKLGWLYHRIPQAGGIEPDYEKATHWFLSCKDRGYNQVREALKLPELQLYVQ